MTHYSNFLYVEKLTDSVTLIRDSERKIIFHSWVIRINSTCAAHINKPQLDSELIKVESRVETFVFTKLTIISDSVCFRVSESTAEW